MTTAGSVQVKVIGEKIPQSVAMTMLRIRKLFGVKLKLGWLKYSVFCGEISPVCIGT